MCQPIHKHQGVAFLQVNLLSPNHMVHIFAFLPGFQHIGMSKIRLMAARDRHRCAITRANIGKRQKDIDLPAAEHIIYETILVAHHAILVAGMHREEATRSSDGSKTLIDE